MYCLLLIAKKKEDYSFMNPETWNQLEVSKIEIPFGHGTKESLKFDHAIIVSATSDVASQAGLQVLKHGGNAMDAALTSVLTSVVLNGGATVSYAGFINAMYYDNTSGQVHTMNGGFNSVKGETNPLSINYENLGRTVLVPGFMKGVESAHKKFGTIPFQELFVPAIHFAETGIAFPIHLNSILQESKENFTSTNTRNLFIKDNGSWIKQGELFRQSQLAETLKKVSEDGAQYMYSGKWAEHFVEQIQLEGGKITMEDMLDYDVIWNSPLTTKYKGFQVMAMPYPNTGGINTVEALNILSNLNMSSSQPYYDSSESLFKLTRSLNVAHLMGTGINYISTDTILDQKPISHISSDYSARNTDENAKKIAGIILSKEWEEFMNNKDTKKATYGGHSDAVIAVDKDGNVATIVHTINTYGWGKNGIFVDGVSIPDAAVYQKHHLANLDPGERVPEATTPIIVLRNGKPFLISNAIANGVHEATVKNLVGVLNYNHNPFEAVSHPDLGVPKLMLDFYENKANSNEMHNAIFGTTVLEGSFKKNLVDSLVKAGQPTYEIDRGSFGNYSGLWIGVKFDHDKNQLEGTSPNPVFGGVKGY